MARTIIQTKLNEIEIAWLDLLTTRLATGSRSETLRVLVRQSATERRTTRRTEAKEAQNAA
jgi:hypothetical protein